MYALSAPKRRRTGRFVRIGLGWLLVVVAVIALLGSPNTSATPSRSCGAPSLIIAFDRNASQVPASQQSGCRANAASAVLGAIFVCALPGSLLLLWPRLKRRYRARRDRAGERAANRTLGRRRRFGPMPLAVSIKSPLTVQQASERLRTLGNGGPRGSLRVKMIGSEYVEARLVSPNTPRFIGELTGTADGSRIVGLVQPPRDSTFRAASMWSVGAGVGVGGLAVLFSSAASGRINGGSVVILVLAVVFGLFAVGVRRLDDRIFPVSANRLGTALATAVDAEPPHLATRPLSPRTATTIAIVGAGLQFAFFGVRIGIVAGPAIGAAGAAFFALIFLLAYRVGKWSRPELRGTELRVGFRNLDLTQVSDVRARGALMALYDGHTRV